MADRGNKGRVTRREDLSTRAASAQRDRIRADTPMAGSRAGGAVSGAEHDAEVRGLGEGAGGKGDNRSRIDAERPRAEHQVARSGEGRVSGADGANRPRLRMPGERD